MKSHVCFHCQKVEGPSLKMFQIIKDKTGWHFASDHEALSPKLEEQYFCNHCLEELGMDE